MRYPTAQKAIPDKQGRKEKVKSAGGPDYEWATSRETTNVTCKHSDPLPITNYRTRTKWYLLSDLGSLLHHAEKSMPSSVNCHLPNCTATLGTITSPAELPGAGRSEIR
jgi:hypothetical protein